MESNSLKTLSTLEKKSCPSLSISSQNSRDSSPSSLLIQRFSKRGYGVAKVKNAPLEIAHTLPGDEILAELKFKKKGPHKGRLLEVLTPSPHRVAPRCTHVNTCGGCTWQQMDYREQLAEKQRRVQAAFPNTPILPILPAPEIWHYRNKMEFTFSENRAGTRFLGLMIAQAEPYVFNVEACHIATPWMTEALTRTRQWWLETQIPAYRPAFDEGILRYLTLRQSHHTGQRMGILNVASDIDPTSFIHALSPITDSLYLRIHHTQRGIPTDFIEKLLYGTPQILEELHLPHTRLSLAISPSSFFQPNTAQAELLYTTALDLLDLNPSDVLYDLYAGTGTLSLAFAQKVARVHSIELNCAATADAAANCARNSITNVALHTGDVGQILPTLSEHPTAMIVDPPRAGLDSTSLAHLKHLFPKKLLYISCNPLTQAENIADLSSHYRLKTLQPIDQFPHTYHIETLALLEKHVEKRCP